MTSSKNYFRYYVSRYKFFFWSGVFALAITNVLDVIPPLILMKGVDQIAGHAELSAVLQTTLLFVTLTLLLAFVRYHWRIQFGNFHQNVARDLRQQIFEKLTQLGPSFYSGNTVGELMSVMTNDVEAIRMGMGPGLIVLTDALLYFLTIPPIMLSLSVPLTFKTLALLPALPVFINWLGHVIHKRFLDVQNEFSNLSALSQESIAGIRIIKSYAQEENRIRVLNNSSQLWRDANLKVAWAETFMHPVMEFCVTVGVVVLLYSGSKSVVAGSLTIGGFVAFQRYITKMVWPMTAIGWGFSLVAQARASIDRVHEFLETKPDVPTVMALGKTDLNGTIAIRNLDFKYPDSDHYALQNISLEIPQGTTLGIVGPVGSGKTTLTQVICHLYAVPRGKVQINDHDLNDIPLVQLRSHISLIPQDTFLFSASIHENMALGLDADPGIEALARVAKVAKLDEEIESLPQRYSTFLGERGINLSGGQKQRMTITRALLRDSPVVIFDDSLSAVDAETESLILKRLRDETRSRTTVIISHRLSSLALCDRIVVLKGGYIEAFGTPTELRSKSQVYRELLQFQGFE